MPFFKRAIREVPPKNFGGGIHILGERRDHCRHGSETLTELGCVSDSAEAQTSGQDKHRLVHRRPGEKQNRDRRSRRSPPLLGVDDGWIAGAEHHGQLAEAFERDRSDDLIAILK